MNGMSFYRHPHQQIVTVSFFVRFFNWFVKLSCNSFDALSVCALFDHFSLFVLDLLKFLLDSFESVIMDFDKHLGFPCLDLLHNLILEEGLSFEKVLRLVHSNHFLSTQYLPQCHFELLKETYW